MCFALLFFLSWLCFRPQCYLATSNRDLRRFSCRLPACQSHFSGSTKLAAHRAYIEPTTQGRSGSLQLRQPLTMGCGATTANDPLAQQTKSRALPSFDELVVSLQQRTISDAARPARGHAFAVKLGSRKAHGDVEHLTGMGNLFSLREEINQEDSKTSWSSWDSRSWQDRRMKGLAMPPDRRRHQRHLNAVNRFQREVERAPQELIKIVASRRSAPFYASTPLSARNDRTEDAMVNQVNEPK